MDTGENIVGFDETTFQSDECQRPYHYLLHYENKCKDIPAFNGHSKEKDKKQCLLVLTRWVNLIRFHNYQHQHLYNCLKPYIVHCFCEVIRNFHSFKIILEYKS